MKCKLIIKDKIFYKNNQIGSILKIFHLYSNISISIIHFLNNEFQVLIFFLIMVSRAFEFF